MAVSNQPIGQIVINENKIPIADAPYIGTNGNWIIWDSINQKYVDSGYQALLKGEQGTQGIGIKTDTAVTYITSGADLGKLEFTLYDPSTGTTSKVKTSNSVKGDKGDKGDTGSTGNGIASVTVTADSRLLITYTNGTSVTTGSVKGDTGERGVQGYSVTSAAVDSSNNLTFTLSSGSTISAGKIAAGNVDTVNT